MSIEVIRAPGAPAPIVPASHAIRAGGLIWLSGVAARDPITGKVVGATIEEQTKRCLVTVRSILEASGSSLGSIVRVLCYLTRHSDFLGFNRAYEEFFDNDRFPARATVVVSALLDPDMLVELVATAIDNCQRPS